MKAIISEGGRVKSFLLFLIVQKMSIFVVRGEGIRREEETQYSMRGGGSRERDWMDERWNKAQ